MSYYSTLIDTDILIEFLRGRTAAQALLQHAHTLGDCACSVITVAELFAGMRPNEERATTALLDGLLILPATADIARTAGRLRQRARTKPATHLADCLIAATAIEHNMALLTNNRKDYPFSELRWFESAH